MSMNRIQLQEVKLKLSGSREEIAPRYNKYTQSPLCARWYRRDDRHYR